MTRNGPHHRTPATTASRVIPTPVPVADQADTTLANDTAINCNLLKNGAYSSVKVAVQRARSHGAILPKTENSIASTQPIAGRTCPGLVRLSAPETLRHSDSQVSGRLRQ
jgi:hypothetical protein